MKMSWKAWSRVYLAFLLALAALAFFWGYPIYRFLKEPATAPAATGADNPSEALSRKEAGGGPRRSVDPRSLLGVHASMVPKFEAMVERVAPDSAEAWTGLGILYQFKELFGDAERCYTKAIGLDPGLPDAHYRLGTVHHARNELYDAISSYKAAMRAKSGYLNAYYSLAAVYQQQEKLDDAIWLYHEIVKMDPKQYQAHNNLGIVLERKGEYREAMKEYARAAELNPRDPMVQQNLETAEREFGRPLRLPPVNPPSERPIPEVEVVPQAPAAPPPVKVPFVPQKLTRLHLKNKQLMAGEVLSRDANGLWLRMDEGTDVYISNAEIERVEE